MARRSRADAGGRDVKKAYFLDSNDVKRIIAEKFGVSEEDVIKSQYSYTVVIEEEK